MNNKKKTVIILVAAAVLLAALTAVLYFGSKKDKAEPAVEVTASPELVEPAAETAEPEPSPEPVEETATEDTAIVIDGTEISAAELNYHYVNKYMSFLDMYGDYASLFGLDTSGDISTLAEQKCAIAEGFDTWRDYFLDTAVSGLRSTKALCDYARSAGLGLSEENLQDTEDMIEYYEAMFKSYGFDSFEDYLKTIYGENITVELFKDLYNEETLADMGYRLYYDALEYTDEDLDAYYETMETGTDDAYPVASMRHILIMAKADDNGAYTDAAIAEAHATAEEIYDQWKNGEATEESFAAFASEFTEDTGSSSNGGYYGDIYKDQMVPGINEFLFEAGREYGDTAVIDNAGGYTGTHVVFFAGYGDLYSRTLARKELLSSDVTAWLSGLCDAQTFEYGPAYDTLGK